MPVDQAGERVVGRLMGQLPRELALLRDISKNQDDADARVVSVPDRRHRHVDIELALIAADQQAALPRSYSLVALEAPTDGVFGRLARDLIEDTKYLGERVASRR